MDITIKCPNCYQQVAKDNRFCIFCGYDLTGSSPVSAEKDPGGYAPAEPAAESGPYDGPCFCPKGHDVPDPSLGFCPVCGSPLVNDPCAPEEPAAPAAEIPAAPPEPVRAPVIRKCSCGYLCDDPDLSFCPACGLPLDGTSSAGASPWVCSCGESNGPDMNFCIVCGKPKGWKPSAPTPAGSGAEVRIPEGMKAPGDDDLVIKSRYGN